MTPNRPANNGGKRQPSEGRPQFSGQIQHNMVGRYDDFGTRSNHSKQPFRLFVDPRPGHADEVATPAKPGAPRQWRIVSDGVYQSLPSSREYQQAEAMGFGAV